MLFKQYLQWKIEFDFCSPCGSFKTLKDMVFCTPDQRSAIKEQVAQMVHAMNSMNRQQDAPEQPTEPSSSDKTCPIMLAMAGNVKNIKMTQQEEEARSLQRARNMVERYSTHEVS